MKPLTDTQRRTFFATVRDAARELGEDAEAYRRRIMREELGAEHLAEVSRTGDFDKLMLRACRDAGDYARALEYSAASVARFRRLIVSAAERIVAATPGWRGSAYDYIAGVMFQSRMVAERPTVAFKERLVGDSAWLDFTEPQLRRLLMMMQTHVRRLAGGGAS